MCHYLLYGYLTQNCKYLLTCTQWLGVLPPFLATFFIRYRKLSKVRRQVLWLSYTSTRQHILFLWKAPGEHLWSGICIILFAQNGGCRGLSPTGCAVRCGGLHKLWLNKTASPVLGLSPFFRLPGCGMIPAYLSTFITFRPLANQPPIITHSPPRPTPPFIHTTHIFIFCSDLKSSTPLLHPFPPPAYAIVHGELEMLHNALPQTSRKVSKGSDFPYETLLVRGQFIR